MSEAKNRDKATKSFTRTELQQFDGKEGRPLYIVFNGKIYDLSRSRLWVQGKHMGVHTRDENLAETIKAAPHGEDILERFPIIGELKEEPQVTPPLEAVIKKPETAFEEPQPQRMERREFLKLIAAAGGAFTIAALASSLKPLTFIPKSAVQLAWPKLLIRNINTNPLSTDVPVVFDYPLTNTPNYLVQLNQQATNGVGPNNNIVAFSGICQHLGCYYGFLSPGSSPPCNAGFKAVNPQGYCCCHGSQYDFVHGAKVIGGPAPRPVPQVQLQYDQITGNIYAVAMGPPTIYGHGPPGTTDPANVLKYDLQGGDIVTSS